LSWHKLPERFNKPNVIGEVSHPDANRQEEGAMRKASIPALSLPGQWSSNKVSPLYHCKGEGV
jgi:hypothetical protein